LILIDLQILFKRLFWME